MSAKKLIKIGGAIIGVGVSVGYAAYVKMKREKEAAIVVEGAEIDIPKEQAEDGTRK